MFVPDEIRDCSCFIGYKSDPNAGCQWIGTAFFVAMPFSDSGRNTAYLLTARHCIERIGQKGCDNQVYVRLNAKDGTASEVTADLSLWVFHPTDDKADCAALPVSTLAPWEAKVFPVDEFATADTIRKQNIGLGDEVFFVGLFKEHVGRSKNVPIIRVGNIAAMPDEPVETRDWGRMRAYLVEARSFGGLSGSPVYVHLDAFANRAPETIILTNGGRLRGRFFFLGLIHGHWDSPDASVEDRAGSDVANMGIAIVVPADTILEVLNHPDLVNAREVLRNQELEQRGPVAG